MGCAKCKAGLCPAYVPSIDSENVETQDLSPKGRTVPDEPGKHTPQRVRNTLVVQRIHWDHF